MNKMTIAAVIAGGLMLMNSPEAAAHKEVRHAHSAHTYAYVDARRAEHMPRWLKRNKAFRHWYARTSLKHDTRFAWGELYDIFRWEARWGRSYFRGTGHWRDYYAHRYSERYFDRDDRRYERRRHHRH